MIPDNNAQDIAGFNTIYVLPRLLGKSVLRGRVRIFGTMRNHAAVEFWSNENDITKVFLPLQNVKATGASC